MSAYLEKECLIEDRVQCLSMHLGLELFLFLWHQIDLDVGVRGSAHVHSWQLFCLNHSHRQLKTKLRPVYTVQV